MRPTLTKGRLTIPSNMLKEGVATFKEFILNPNDVTDNKVTNYGELAVAGASHPVYQFGSGGERLVTFELFLDAVLGRKVGADIWSEWLTLKDEIKWYRSLLYPIEYAGMYGRTHPPVVLFTFGSLYDSLPCIVKRADVKISYWSPKLEPLRATISLGLAEYTTYSQTGY